MTPTTPVTLTDPAALRYVRCPLCARQLRAAVCEGGPARLVCGAGHSFDIARRGYVSFIVGQRAAAGGGDDARMVAARSRFLTAGYYEPIVQALTRAARRAFPDRPGLVVDAATGPGYYLGALVSALEAATGIGLDLSAQALRRAARAHPRILALGADIWRPLPLADACADLLLSVFGPRNGPEFARVLAPGGALLVVTPRPDHLRELVGPLGLIDVAADKHARLAAQLESFALAESESVQFPMRLDRGAVADLVAMGPNARHLSPAELVERAERLPATVRVGAHVDVAVYRLAADVGGPR